MKAPTQLARQTVLNTGLTYAGLVLGFVNVAVLYPRFLPDDEFGLTRLLVSVATIGGAMAQFGLDNTIVRYFPYFRDASSRNKGLLSVILLVASLGACVAVLCIGLRLSRRSERRRLRQHNGLDLANPNGGYIYTAGDGWIVTADYRSGYGNFIEIDHGNGVRTRYAHMAEFDPNLRSGVRVAAGVPIGRMGMTGNATGVHLHYEVVVDGLLVDPLNYGAPQPYQTTPVMQTFDELAPIDPEPEQSDSSESFPEPVRLRQPQN